MEFPDTYETVEKIKQICAEEDVYKRQELDETRTSREVIKTRMLASLDVATDPWGIKVNRVELKNIIPPAACLLYTSGTGHVDFPAVIRETWKAGVRRYVTEFWYTGNPGWKEELDFAVGMMRPILDAQIA